MKLAAYVVSGAIATVLGQGCFAAAPQESLVPVLRQTQNSAPLTTPLLSSEPSIPASPERRANDAAIAAPGPAPQDPANPNAVTSNAAPHAATTDAVAPVAVAAPAGAVTQGAGRADGAETLPEIQVVKTLRPKLRPQSQPAPRASLQSSLMASAPAEAPSRASAAAGMAAASAAAISSSAVVKSLRPIVRPPVSSRPSAQANTAPANVVSAAVVRTPTPAQPSSGKVGKICGNRAIRGQNLSPITGKLTGCSIPNPVRVYEVDGVKLSTPATMDCTTAEALNTWVKNGVRPAIGRLGGGVSSMRVVASYSCRTRNSKPGAKLSEHGKGHAVDIAAFTLDNGSTITVINGWKQRAEGKILKAMHASACGPFGTVLGPNADKYHRDHFHLDTARYRSGSYCR